MSIQVSSYEVYVELAEALNRLAPGTQPKKTLLVTTGAEAIENAVKIARFSTARPAVILHSAEDFMGGTAYASADRQGQALQGRRTLSRGRLSLAVSDGFAGQHREVRQCIGRDLSQHCRSGAQQPFLSNLFKERGFNIAPFSFLKRLREIPLIDMESCSSPTRFKRALAVPDAFRDRTRVSFQT